MDDLISRQAAIDAVMNTEPVFDGGGKTYQATADVISALTNLPSAHPLDPCETCLHKGKGWDEDPCDGCTGTESKYIPDNGWIPVSEMLPEEDKDVLVTVYFKGLVQKHKTGWNDHIKPKSYVEVASQIDGEWHSYSDEYKVARDRHVVTAWQPLPDPYKEEEC